MAEEPESPRVSLKEHEAHMAEHRARMDSGSASTTPYALTREERHLLSRIEATEEAVLELYEQHMGEVVGRSRWPWPIVGPIASVRRSVMRKRKRLAALRHVS